MPLGHYEKETTMKKATTDNSPDQMITCPKCHKRFRVGKKNG